MQLCVHCQPKIIKFFFLTARPALPFSFSFHRKRALLQHLNATKQRLHRLQILLQWCHKASAVAECKRVLEVSSTHANAFRDAADQLVYLHGELVHSKAPAYDVPTAIHVLSSGGYAALPTIIENELKVVAPGKDKKNATSKNSNLQTTPEQLEKGKAVLRRLDFLIRSKLLEEGVPTGMRVERISNGEAVVSSSTKQYTATISLVPAPSTEVTLAKWTPPGTEQQQQQQEQEIAQPIKQEEKDDGGGGDGEKEKDKIKIEAMDIDGVTLDTTATENNAKDDTDTSTAAEKGVSETSLWRWRLISFQLLPSHPPALLPPHLVPWLIRNVEDRMWAASDIQQLIKLGKSDLVVVPPPPMTRKQRERRQKEIDQRGREGLPLPGSLSLSRSQPSGSLPGGGTAPAMSGGSEQVTTTTTGAAGEEAGEEAGAPGVIPIWAQSPLAALHAVLQHTSAKLAIGSVLMEEAKMLENGSGLAGGARNSGSGGGGSNNCSGAWSDGNLRISKLEDHFGVKFTLWPRVPLLSTSELTTILGDDGEKSEKVKKEESLEKKKKEGKSKDHHPSLGWVLQVEVPPPTYESNDKKTTTRKKKEGEKENTSSQSDGDGTITCVCVPPLRNPTSLSVWSDDGSLSTENLLLRASAQHAHVQLLALQQSFLMPLQKEKEKASSSDEAQHAQQAQQLDEVLGVGTWKVDIVDTSTTSNRTARGPALPAMQCSFNTHAMLLLHFNLTDGQPVLSLGPLLTESGVELASEAENVVKKGQIALNKKLEAVLTEVLPAGVTRSILWLTTITEAIVETWKHLVALQRKEEVLIHALGYGFGRAVLPRCLEGVELELGSSGGGGGSGEKTVAAKETTVVLRAPYFKSPTLSSPLKESVPMGKQGSLVCYLLADVTTAAAVVSTENFAKQLRLALCWATPRGVPTSLRRIIPVPVNMVISNIQSDAEKLDLKKKQQPGGNKATTTKRKRQEEEEEDETTTAPPATEVAISCVKDINWEKLQEWCLSNIAVHQLEAQLEAADCTAAPTEDKTAVRVLLSTVPWLSSLTSSSTSPLFEFMDEEIQFSLDPGRSSSPQEGAFLTTLVGGKFSMWKKDLEKHGLQNLIKINGGEKYTISGGGGTKEKIVVKCVLQEGQESAAGMVAKAACVGVTTAIAGHLATALKKQQQQEEKQQTVSIQSVDLDRICLKYRDISFTVQYSVAASRPDTAPAVAAGGGGDGAATGNVAGASRRRVMMGVSPSQHSQPIDNTTTTTPTTTAGGTVAIPNPPPSSLVCCSLSSSPPLPPLLLRFLESQLSVETTTPFDVGSFVSVVRSVASSAAVLQAVVLDAAAQHAAGLLPGAVTVEALSFEPTGGGGGPGSASAAAVSAAAAVGVCRLLVHQLGRSLQLQMVFQSSGAVMLRARQLPPTKEQQQQTQPAAGAVGGEVAWLQEAWSKIALKTGVHPTSANNTSNTEWNHVLVTLLPEQLGPVLTSLLHSVSRKE